MRRFHRGLRDGDLGPFEELVTRSFVPGRVAIEELAYGEGAWRAVLELYGRNEEEPPFIDYFWTWRFTHLPIFRALLAEVPRAHCYHAVSTGYAGLMAAAARVRSGAPMVLTEHGIYTRERRLEIAHAEWIPDADDEQGLEGREGFFKEWWARLFGAMARIAYATADQITTIFEGNRRLQVAEGADPARIRVIPNGVEVEAYEGLRPAGRPGSPPVVALVGRVVPIKDVKTFLRSVKSLSERVPDVQVWVLGPTEEEPDYFRDCLVLAEMLGIEHRVDFKGKVDLRRHWGQVDVLVLTSISEGQPLVILEAMAAGVPSVATDVGACRELLEGVAREDRALGPSGEVTPIGDSEATARAVERILGDVDLYGRMVGSGRKRVHRYYRSLMVSAQYQEIYEELPLQVQAAGGAPPWRG
ncbi:MAG: GT4 family glycosyltransferase PelF [Planctomycetes bacterium]|nr:GT4 family glycosyltransferase PelF [Planctomycetota bacterium]